MVTRRKCWRFWKILIHSVYTPLIYIVASTDDTSLRRVQAQQQARRADAIYKLPRSREVGQSYISSIFTTLWSFIIALYYVAVIRPDLLLCNGPGTCLPVAIATLCIVFLDSVEAISSFANPFVESQGKTTCVFDEYASMNAILTFVCL